MRGLKLLSIAGMMLGLGSIPCIVRANSIDLDVENGGVLITNANYSSLGYGVVSADVGDYLYTYTINIGPGENTSSVGYFTVVDFSGLVAGSASYTADAAPAGSSTASGVVSTPLIGDLGNYLGLDSPTVADLEVKLSGASNVTGNSFDLGTLAAVSIYAPTGHSYASDDNVTAGGTDPNHGFADAPTPPGGLPGLPLPASVWGCGTLLALLASARVKFSKRALV